MAPRILATFLACLLVLGITSTAPASEPDVLPVEGARLAADPTYVQDPSADTWATYASKTGRVTLSYPRDYRVGEWKPHGKILESVSFIKRQATAGHTEEHADAIELTRFTRPQGQSLRDWIANASTPRRFGLELSPDKIFFETRKLRPLTADGNAYSLWHRVEGESVYAVILDGGSSVVVLTMVSHDPHDMSGPFQGYARSITVNGKRLLRAVGSTLAPDAAPIYETDSATTNLQLMSTSSYPGYYLPWRNGTTRTVLQGPGPDPQFYSHDSQPNYYGYDWDLPEGSEIWASAPGTVRFSRGNVGANVCGGSSYASYTNYVTIYHSDGRATVYVHLKSITRSSGTVGQGDLLAYSGKTGWTYCSAHLHFQKQEQGGWFTNSSPVYFQEYPGQTFYYPSRLTSRNSRVSISDTSGPSARPPVQRFESGATIGTVTTPVKLTWSAASPGSGVSRYQLQQSTNSGAYAEVSLPAPGTTAIRRWLRPAYDYRFRVRVLDTKGVWSAWAYGPRFKVTAYQETSGAVAYNGGWKNTDLSWAYGGAVKYQTSAGSRARLSFTGRNVEWVTAKGPTRGRAHVYVDGVYATSVDLYSATTLPRKAVYTRDWASSGTHTVEVRLEGTAGRPRVDVDAFLTLR